jgi:hypothetical protein
MYYGAVKKMLEYINLALLILGFKGFIVNGIKLKKSTLVYLNYFYTNDSLKFSNHQEMCIKFLLNDRFV